MVWGQGKKTRSPFASQTADDVDGRGDERFVLLRGIQHQAVQLAHVAVDGVDRGALLGSCNTRVVIVCGYIACSYSVWLHSV